MKKEIEISGKIIEYTLKISRRARSMRLTVYTGGNLIVSVPRYVSEEAARRFIIQKSDWVIKKITHLKLFNKALFPKHSKADQIKYKKQALLLVENKITEFNKFYNFKFNDISIKNQKTRWGSCSRKGNLNFNYKILFLPPRLADYIVVHEICHLKEFNHSKNFWNLVAKTIPDYLDRRRELRSSGLRFG